MAGANAITPALATAAHTDELHRLTKVLRCYQGFQLILALYTDPPAYRDSLITSLNQPFTKPALLDIRTLPDFATFEQQINIKSADADVVHVIGLDAWLLGEQCTSRLQNFNIRRESLAHCCNKPLVLWLPEYLAKDFALQAPDCWEWRRAVVDFSYLPEPAITEQSKVPLDISTVEKLDFQPLEEWSHARFLVQQNRIEQALDSYQLQTAYQQADNLLNQALNAGTTAYANADYDIAIAQALLGHILNSIGYAETALPLLKQAQQRFQTLADARNQNAARMVSATLTEQADCLRAMGQLEVAAELYLQSLGQAEKLNDKIQVAVNKVQLATVRKNQKDYPAALAAYAEARELFEQLNEPRALAAIWHQTGIAYKQMQEFETAERCYRESLNIKSQQDNQAGIASSLGELGNLYDAWGRLEQAVVFYRQASDSYIQLGDKAGEGRQRYNLANSLIKLQRYEEARVELQRVIECDKAFGHSAQPWKTWDILCDLEQACHNPTATHAAKQKAIQSYLAYRRDGGENMSGSKVLQLCQAVLQAIRDNNRAAVLENLRGFENLAGLPNYLKPVIPKLIAILQGERNPSLADDPELDYNSAAELLLLLEQLG
jgi:tetratricopeptide (TPR) repeat protein